MSRFMTITIGLIFILMTGQASAYIDQGAVGLAYQYAYLIFYGIITFIVILFRPIKNLFVKEKPKSEAEEGAGSGASAPDDMGTQGEIRGQETPHTIDAQDDEKIKNTQDETDGKNSN